MTNPLPKFPIPYLSIQTFGKKKSSLIFFQKNCLILHLLYMQCMVPLDVAMTFLKQLHIILDTKLQWLDEVLNPWMLIRTFNMGWLIALELLFSGDFKHVLLDLRKSHSFLAKLANIILGVFIESTKIMHEWKEFNYSLIWATIDSCSTTCYSQQQKLERNHVHYTLGPLLNP